MCVGALRDVRNLRKGSVVHFANLHKVILLQTERHKVNSQFIWHIVLRLAAAFAPDIVLTELV